MKYQMALQHAKKKYGDVVEISQGHTNVAWEEYQTEATGFDRCGQKIVVYASIWMVPR